MVLEFTVPGEPVAKGRPRFTRAGFSYTPKKTERFENLVRMAFSEKYPNMVPAEQGISLRMHSKYLPPKSWSKKKKGFALLGKIFKTTKPDLDNLIKSVCDGLNGVAWKDDAQVYELYARKEYAEIPCTYVSISIQEEEQP